MTQRIEQMAWKSVLSPAFKWLETVKITTGAKDVKKDAWHVVPVTKDTETVKWDGIQLDKAWIEKITTAAAALNWVGKPTTMRLQVDNMKFLLVGIPSLAVKNTQKARQVALDAVADLRDAKANEITICAHNDLPTTALLEGFLGAYYDPNILKGSTTTAPTFPQNINLTGTALNDTDMKTVKAMAQATVLMRTMQDAPANWMTPARFAEIAQDLCGSSTKVNSYGREDMRKMGMGSFLSVAAGADSDPKMVVMEIAGKNTNQTVALVGKGVTFDAGGICIKPSAGIAEMKYDMSGAAAVLSAGYYFTKVPPPVNVVILLGAVENLLGGSATKPGDVVQSYSGKTIEVLNTDAEGRLVLCDVMSYAQDKFKPAMMIDIATLTGGAIYALGHAGAALIANTDQTATFMEKMADMTGEPLWRLPLWPELAKESKGDVADLKNIAKPNVMASTIMGGHFLREFITLDKMMWAHVDVAGTAWSCTATGYPTTGGSAYGLRLMIKACEEFGH